MQPAGDLTVRERLEKREKIYLSDRAQLDSDSRGRNKQEPVDPLRTDYQLDRDRIVYSPSFRRLKFKTQVFIEPIRDDTRTRLTHTLEVTQLSRTVARALTLNEDLTEAIALGHDLGHVPFAHVGEEVLNELTPGGFHHSKQSLRVVESLEKEGCGLNLTAEVRDGIARHSKKQSSIFKPVSGKKPLTLEAAIVRYCDSIAYLNHDIEDAVRAGYLEPDSIPQNALNVLGKNSATRIDKTIQDMIITSQKTGEISMSPSVGEATDLLRDFMFEELYLKLSRSPIDIEARSVLMQMYDFLTENKEIIFQYCPFLSETKTTDPVVDFISLQSDLTTINLYRKYIGDSLNYLPEYRFSHDHPL